MADLPYQAEYAKSGRAKCKLCKNPIDQGVLRLAVMVQSAFFDGKEAHWHHEQCFFKKARITSVAEIANFTKLRTKDKQSIKDSLESEVPSVPAKGKGKGKKRAADPSVTAAVRDFAVEYAKSNRSTCKHCDIKICKGDVRICKTVFDTDVGKKYGGQPLWHHPKCFAEVRSTAYFLFEPSGEYLPGFNTLSKEDQEMVKELIKPLNEDQLPIKKIKSEPKTEKEEKEEKKEQAAKEKLIEKQNKLYHKYKNALSEYSKADLQELLEHNSQEAPSGLSDCIDRLAECMAFGALEPCPECKHGQLVVDNFGYRCTGNVTDWSKCQYTTQDPKKVPMKVPKSFKESSAFHRYKPKVQARVFEMAPPPPAIVVKPEVATGIKKDIPVPPLKNLQFYLHKVSKGAKETLTHRILRLGGLVVSQPNDTTAAAVSNQKEIKKMSNKMQEIQQLDIEVVEESFFDLIPNDGTIQNTLDLIKKHNIADWGSDPMKRVPQDVIDGKFIEKSGSQYMKSSKSGVTKLKIKGGTAVDPDSGLEDTAHVYRDHDGTKYTVTLSKTDVVMQKNSYYKLQVLEHDNKNKYWLFRAWGRIGTKSGGKKLEEFKSLEKAISTFEDVYMERTENPWEFREDFMKVAGCYYPIDLDYGDDDIKAELKLDMSCNLPLEVQQLIMKIFDIDVMKKTLLEFELDTEKMPLGKLSKKQIKSGYKVLSELLKHIEKGEVSQTKIVDATNRFFTLVPHDFGSNNAPLLNSVDMIMNKTQMLDNLLEIEIAYSLLKTDSDASSSPIESHYMKLKADISPLLLYSEEYKMIAKYAANTHAATHSNYTLELQQVFQVVREGEGKRYKPFKKLHNRRLLWHGSRITNFAGILSQGLRIAPPEAPVTGYMFGKGIYFADMVSKSANYCCTNKSNPVGLLMLCEVALGDMKECHRAENITKLPAGKHSAWGVGRTCPDPDTFHTLEDGIIVPYGKPVTKKVDTGLLYNEYIVYDVAQVNVKYLLQVKFNFK